MMLMKMNVIHGLILLLLSLLFLFTSLMYPMKRLRVASLNINSGRDQHKRALVSNMVSKKKLDIVFL